jgi:hypothetical protein
MQDHNNPSGDGWRQRAERIVGPLQPYASPVLGASVLLEETSGVRPSHGVLVLANGRQELVPFTRELEAELDRAVQRMRQILESPETTEEGMTKWGRRASGRRRARGILG